MSSTNGNLKAPPPFFAGGAAILAAYVLYKIASKAVFRNEKNPRQKSGERRMNHVKGGSGSKKSLCSKNSDIHD